jgi:hypothetical protein
LQLISQDTFPKSKQKSTISIIENDKTIKMTQEDDKVTSLEIDGKIIPPSEYDQYQDELSRVKPLNGKHGQGFIFGDGFNGSFGRINMDSMMNSFPQMHFEDLRDNIKMWADDDKGFIFNMDSFPHNFESFPGHVFKFNKGNFNLDSLVGGRFEMLKDLDGMKNFSFNFPEGEYIDNWGPNARPLGQIDNKNDYQSILGNALNSDGLLIPGKINNVELTGKFLKINGEKQPSNLWDKYKRIFEEESGLTLEPKSKLNFKIEGVESKRKYRVF